MLLDRVLVPLDGTPDAAAALPLARTLARASNGTLILFRAAPASRPDANRAGAEEAAVSLDRLARELQSGGIYVHSVVEQGDPAEEIVRAARAQQADLIVMATHGRSGLARAILGSTAERVLAHTPVPLLLVRPGGRRVDQVRTLLVPVDGTPGGSLALAAAVPLARATGSRIVLVQVVVPTPGYIYGPYLGGPLPSDSDAPWDEEARGAAQQYLADLCVQLRAADIPAEGRALIGPVSETITRVADEAGADLVVMSTHALVGPARAVLGSVADAVVRTARQPVLLVRRGAALVGAAPAERHDARPALVGVGPSA